MKKRRDPGSLWNRIKKGFHRVSLSVGEETRAFDLGYEIAVNRKFTDEEHKERVRKDAQKIKEFLSRVEQLKGRGARLAAQEKVEEGAQQGRSDYAAGAFDYLKKSHPHVANDPGRLRRRTRRHKAKRRLR